MLHGKRVAIEQGYNLQRKLSQDHPGIELLAVENTLKALQTVSREEADAYVGNQAVILYLLQKHRLINLKVTADSGYSDNLLHFGVRPDWPELVSILNKALQQIPHDAVQAIDRKWLGFEQQVVVPSGQKKFTLTREEKAWLDENKPFDIAVMDSWPPFNFVDGQGVSRGIGIDYVDALKGYVIIPVEEYSKLGGM